MTRRDALIGVIEALHAEIAALKANDVAALERATRGEAGRDRQRRAVRRRRPAGAELRELADEAHRLNETCRIYVNLMAANVRRRLQTLAGDAGAVLSPAVAMPPTPESCHWHGPC